ncbi:MAG: choice-of-anchor J domain-containing protein [Bacteroidales bacterium]|nr:choice-of-anchor J domain-containing protein [Bacteroidales bacterium]
MKKLVLVAIALMMSMASFAQFSANPQVKGKAATKDALPNWTPIQQTFVATDINGNTVNIADTLAAGKSVVIDYSAVWCYWCWVLHSHHILEAIHNQLGESVCVLWVEADPSTGSSGLYGAGGVDGSQGDWTNQGTVPYPIIDDPNTTCLVGDENITGYPSVFFVSASGYYCDLYGASWGFGPDEDTNVAVNKVRTLLNTYPRANTAPVISINGNNAALKDAVVTFNANIVSVDSVTSIEWAFSNGTPATVSGQTTASTTWNNLGTETVTLTVTNTTGSTTATLSVNVFDYSQWGDEMDYTNGADYTGSIGLSSGATFYWGVKYPAELMAGRNYLNQVKLYGNEAANVTLNIYQTNPNSEPTNADLVYTYNYTIAARSWNTLSVFSPVQLDVNKDLYVTFAGSGYVATGCEYNGDPNSCLIQSSGWQPIVDINPDLSYTWMIKAVTGAQPDFHLAISGPDNAKIGEPVTFTAITASSATLNWEFEHGNPATSTSFSPSVTWSEAGSFRVTLTATLNGETLTVSKQVNIPLFYCGFEAGESLSEWNFVDADGDGYSWDFSNNFSSAAHTGTGIAASASYINNIGILNPDNWMITPKITIPANGAFIEWWEYGVDVNDYADHYGVFVSTTGNTPADFTEYTIFEGAPTSGQTWVKHSRSLVGFAGQDIYIAFRHWNIENMYWLLIDDIAVTEGDHAGIDNVSDVRVALFPNPTSSILNIAAEGVKEVSVLDVNGRTVMTEKNVNSIDMTELANGVYFVRVITNDGISTQKIVKK